MQSLPPLKNFLIKRKLLLTVIDELGNAPIESGGILGIRDGMICSYFHDGYTAYNEYRPDVRKLNQVILQWSKQGIEFAGIVHSHPNGCLRLSPADFDYAKMILNNDPEIGTLIFSIFSVFGGKKRIAFYDCLHGGQEIIPILV